MGSPAKTHRRGGKKGRKIGRNYRWAGQTRTITKYRARHGIPADAKRGASRKT